MTVGELIQVLQKFNSDTPTPINIAIWSGVPYNPKIDRYDGPSKKILGYQIGDANRLNRPHESWSTQLTEEDSQ